MISSETPYKLAEIIRDTWPGLYRFDGNKINKQNNGHTNGIESRSSRGK